MDAAQIAAEMTEQVKMKMFNTDTGTLQDEAQAHDCRGESSTECRKRQLGRSGSAMGCWSTTTGAWLLTTFQP
jgi:hypothetical protein